MSILIENMEMPTHCSVCKFFDHGDCELLPYGDYIDDKHRRRDNCPLVSIPPHGDLIDRYAAIRSAFKGEQNIYCWDEIEEAIDSVPTIIEADKDINVLNKVENASIGRWELKTFDDGYGEYQLYECDKCGAVTAQRKNYCYDCGARMAKE